MYPILVGQVEEVQLKGKPLCTLINFREFDAEFPDKLHYHEYSPRLMTIKETLTEIFKIQGLHLDPRRVDL